MSFVKPENLVHVQSSPADQRVKVKIRDETTQTKCEEEFAAQTFIGGISTCTVIRM